MVFHGIEKRYYVGDILSGECAKYARIVAEREFNKKYHPSDAWNLMYFNRIVCNFEKEKKTLEDLFVESEFKPGQLVVFYYPDTTYGSGKDVRGNKKIGTHVALYIGKKMFDYGLDFTFVHQVIGVQEKVALKFILKELRMVPKVVLDEPNNL